MIPVEVDRITGNYPWLHVEFPDDPRLTFLRTGIPSDVQVLETWHVTVEETPDGTAARAGPHTALVTTTRQLGEFVYGAIHDRVLAHARAQGWLRLHMALVEVGGRRVGIVGRSGAGKSTTVITLAGRGARILSDDVVFLRAGRIIALPRPLHLRPDALTRLPGSVRSSVLPLDYDPPVFVLDPVTAGWAATENPVAPLDAVVVLIPEASGPAPSTGPVTLALTELMPDAAAFNPAHADLVAQVTTLLTTTPLVVLPRSEPTDMARRIEATLP